MRRHVNTALSLTALVVAIGAATPMGQAAWNAVVPRNSVGTLQLKRNAVTSSKLAPNTVRTGQVVDSSLLTADFKPGQIPQGPKGDKGDKGDKGNKGDPGATKVTVRWSTVLTGPVFGGRTATCNAGEVAVGGGGGLTTNTGASGGAILVDSKPIPNTAAGTPTGWFAAFSVTGPFSVAAYAICARP